MRSKLRNKVWKIQHFEIDSVLLERWLLKSLINLNFGHTLKFGDTDERQGVPSRELVRIAFGIAKFQGSAGMYVAVRPNEQIAGLEGVSITVYNERDSLIVAEFTICGLRFLLNLVQEEVHEFQGSKLLHKKFDIAFRVPDHKLRMVHSHVIHIK